MRRRIVVAPLAAGLVWASWAGAAPQEGGPKIVLEEVQSAAEAGVEASAPAGAFAGAKRMRVAPYRFQAQSGERLSQALRAFLEREGWQLAWEAQGDFVIAHGFAVEAPELKPALERVLGAFGLAATLYEGNRVAAVRHAAVLP